MLSNLLLPTKNNPFPVKFNIKTEKTTTTSIDEIEIIKQISSDINNPKSIPFKIEADTNNQIIITSHKSRLEQIELENKILLETIQIKNELIKQTETRLIDLNEELKNVIEINEMKLNFKQNEINDLNNKLQKSLEIIDLNSKNEMNLLNKIKQLEVIQKILLEDEFIDDIETNDLNETIIIDSDDNQCESIEQNNKSTLDSIPIGISSSSGKRDKTTSCELTVKLKSNQKLCKNIWKSFKKMKFTDQLYVKYFKCLSRNNLKKNQIKEYDLIDNLSKRLIIDNYNRTTKLLDIKNTSQGYSIDRRSGKKENCKWNINIDLNTNEATITCKN